MKILHVIPSIGPARGGPSQAVLAMTRALRRAGTDADIVTTNDNGAGLLPVLTGSWQEYEGVNVYFLPRWSPSVAALREFQYAPDFTAWLETHLPNYDGVHAHAIFSFLPTKAMTVCRRLGKSFITRPLGQLDPWSLNQKAFKKRLYYRLMEKGNLIAARAIHCTSETEAKNARALLPEARVEIIPHGVELAEPDSAGVMKLRQKWDIAPDRKVILFLSRWHPKKNIPLLLEALSGLKESPWVLVLAGSADDGYENIVRRNIFDLGLDDRVICPGHVLGHDKDILLSGADLFVLPSITENFGVAVAEALCYGLPCVVTEGVDLAPAVRELSGGVVCSPDVLSLRQALSDALQKSFDRPQLRKDATQRFSWDTAAHSLRQLYADVFTPCPTTPDSRPPVPA